MSSTATRSKRSSSSKSGSHKKSGGSGRCWSGYEPTPGKKPGSKGSCRKK
ncbi:MAG TPA: hypothetical protein VF796_23755 [Humisphaera sp.]